MPRPYLIAVLALAAVISLNAGCKSEAPAAAQKAQKNVLTTLKSTGKDVLADAVVGACSSKDWCVCVLRTVPAALDVELNQDAVTLLDSASKCSQHSSLHGMRAEALVKLGKTPEGVAAANDVLKTDPADKHATYALAHASYLQGDRAQMKQQAQKAADAGRGAPARVLLGLAAFYEGNLAQAQSDFESAHQQAPWNVLASYNLGLVHQRLNHYSKARELYLATLKTDPKHFESRFNLVVLTRDAGARQEADHHLTKLQEAYPTDPRVAQLRLSLSPEGGQQ